LSKVVPDKREQIKVLQDFWPYIQTDLSKLVEMLGNSDAVNIESTAHRMKGSCRMVGATRMASACAAIEIAGRDGKLDEVQAGLLELKEACRLFEVHLIEIKDSNGAQR